MADSIDNTDQKTEHDEMLLAALRELASRSDDNPPSVEFVRLPVSKAVDRIVELETLIPWAAGVEVTMTDSNSHPFT